MIKYLLISSVMGLNVTYPNIDVCKEALTQVVKHDEKAICIPAGEDQASMKMEMRLNGPKRQIRYPETITIVILRRAKLFGNARVVSKRAWIHEQFAQQRERAEQTGYAQSAAPENSP